MSKLERLLEQEQRFERSLVFYSVSIPPPTEPPGPPPSEPCMSFSDLLTYANHLSKQYGVPSSSVKPEAPSKPVSLETFNPVEVMQAISKPYKSILSEEEIAYATILSKQSNVPSLVIEPVQITSNPIDPKTFDLGQALIAINSFTHDSTSNNLTIQSSSAKPIEAYIYNPPEFKTPGYNTLNLDNQKIFSINDSKPEKKFYESFKEEHTVRICGLKHEKPVYDLFKKNEFANIYNQVTKGLKLGKEAIKTITFTNPLKNEDDFSPSFTPYDKDLRFPAIKPKKIPFDMLSQKDYNKMLNNAFLPHELGHAKIEEKHHKYPGLYSDELKGFNEHLADAWSLDSVKNTPQLFNTKMGHINFENTWVTPSNNISRAKENYEDFITSKEEASFIIGKQASINILDEPLLKQKYDHVLKEALDFKYGQDSHKHTVYENINNLSSLYQEGAVKIIKLSKKDTILSNFKAKRVLSNIEKETFRFNEDLS